MYLTKLNHQLLHWHYSCFHQSLYYSFFFIFMIFPPLISTNISIVLSKEWEKKYYIMNMPLDITALNKTANNIFSKSLYMYMQMLHKSHKNLSYLPNIFSFVCVTPFLFLREVSIFHSDDIPISSLNSLRFSVYLEISFLCHTFSMFTRYFICYLPV